MWSDFGGGVSGTAACRESVNTMGEIPVFEDGAKRLTQTAPILLRLSQRYGGLETTWRTNGSRSYAGYSRTITGYPAT